MISGWQPYIKHTKSGHVKVYIYSIRLTKNEYLTILVFSLGHMMHCVIEVAADIDILKKDPECAGPTAENIIFQIIVFIYTLFQFVLLFKFSKVSFSETSNSF